MNTSLYSISLPPVYEESICLNIIPLNHIKKQLLGKGKYAEKNGENLQFFKQTDERENTVTENLFEISLVTVARLCYNIVKR